MSKYFTNNKLAYWSRSSDYLNGERIIPVTWELDLTTRCNQDCPGCTGNRFFGAQLEPSEAIDYVKQIRELGGQGLILTGGGDPTVNRKALMAVMGMMPTLLFTHGELFDEELANAVLPNLKGIRFSLDAYDAETAHKNRGITPERWAKTLDNIRKSVEVKKQLGLNLPIGVAYLTDKERNRGILKFADVANDLGVDYAQCRPMLWSTSQQKQHDWDFQEFQRIYNEASNRYPDLMTCSSQKYEHIDKGTEKRCYPKCHTGRFASTIGADSKVYFCCHTRYMESFALGDLKKESLREIFSQDRVEQMRDKMSFEVCPILCRGDSINRTVTEMQENKPEHLMFL